MYAIHRAALGSFLVAASFFDLEDVLLRSFQVRLAIVSHHPEIRAYCCACSASYANVTVMDYLDWHTDHHIDIRRIGFYWSLFGEGKHNPLPFIGERLFLTIISANLSMPSRSYTSEHGKAEGECQNKE
jgi:hypothetical protein